SGLLTRIGSIGAAPSAARCARSSWIIHLPPMVSNVKQTLGGVVDMKEKFLGQFVTGLSRGLGQSFGDPIRNGWQFWWHFGLQNDAWCCSLALFGRILAR